MPEEMSESSKNIKNQQGKPCQSLFQDIPQMDQSILQIC